jgi:hypothetical protein
MACITTLQQSSTTGAWVGRDIRTGKEYPFATLADYQIYTKSLEAQGKYCAPVTPVYNTQYTPGENRQSPVFMEFLPRDPATQAKYSAMSPTWEGVASSEAAIARGDYDLDKADVRRDNTQAVRPQPVLPKPGEQTAAAGWNCSIQ